MSVHLICTNNELESCLTHLSTVDELALDLEFDKNFYHYGFNLCLVQIFAEGECYLIDPLSDQLEIDSVFKPLEDTAIEKVVFAFGEDLRLLHSIGCFPKNIYDLNIATSLLNYTPASLTNYLVEILGIETGKSSQQSNWFKRPLTSQQLNYAAEDVIHLFKLKNLLEQEAKQKNIKEWIEEENSFFDEMNYSDIDSNNAIKQKDKKDLSEHEWYLFKKLIDFRENLAEKYNKPGYQIIKKEYLKEIAKDSRKLMKWQNTRGIYPAIRNKEVKDQLIELLKNSSSEADHLNLSKTDPADKPLNREEYNVLQKEKTKINHFKNEFFQPIKNRIVDIHGEEAASFMLSNRIMNEIITGKRESIASYKLTLIEKYADELGLNPDQYLHQTS